MLKIFLSYRRSDNAYAAGWIFTQLAARFGRDNVFMDVAGMPLGVDFRKHLRDAVNQCGVLLAVIGDHWLDARHEDGPHKGKRRLDDPEDFVRLEIEAALARDIPIVPVLVGRASMPREKDLPDGLKALAYRHAAEVRPEPDFQPHVQRLIGGLEELLRGEESRQVDVAVPGRWFFRPADSPTGEWVASTRTPGPVRLVPGKAYRFFVDQNATEHELVRFSHLPGFTGLQELDLGHCEELTDTGLVVLRAFPRLETLSLVGCQQLTDTGLAHLRAWSP
jgi:hypothetical protein